MAGRDLIVERVVNGARSERFSERLPADTLFVVQAEDDHVHLVLGTAEELAGVGITADDTISRIEEVAAKPKRKRTARKPAAKK